jgi:hypothetical protein
MDIGKPYIDKKNTNEIYRTFKYDVDSEDLVWHRDKEDRIVKSIESTDWMVQLDNELPKNINSEIFIPKEVWHRLIKGTGDLNLIIKVI